MDFFNIFIGDTTWTFILEILVRCFLMFIIIISFLRLSGKRGVRQLSLFELAIILCLGSATGENSLKIIHFKKILNTLNKHIFQLEILNPYII